MAGTPATYCSATSRRVPSGQGRPRWAVNSSAKASKVEMRTWAPIGKAAACLVGDGHRSLADVVEVLRCAGALIDAVRRCAISAVPSLQAMHWPQDSAARNRAKPAATRTMQRPES